MQRYVILKAIILLPLLFILSIPVEAEDISVSAAVEKQEVFVGESFILQISVQGSDKPETPNISGLTDFEVDFLGGTNNSSTFTTIINNKKNTVVYRGYIFQYRLIPKKSGTLTIPPIMMNVEGNNYMTSTLSVKVIKPSEVEDYKVRQYISKQRCYIGEKLTLTVSWYFAKNVDEPSFSVPFLTSKDFTIIAPPTTQKSNTKYYTFLIGREEVVFELGQATLAGKEYSTLSFSRMLIPRKSGNFTIPGVSIEFAGVAGTKKVRDWFGRVVEQPVYKTYVIPSNELSLNVLAAPPENRPANYTGLIGSYTIEATASPTSVYTGDPITLTLKLRGTGYLHDAEIPNLGEIVELTTDFKIPAEMSAGKVAGNVKTFTQTLRAITEKVTHIPPITISYFNPATQRYEYTSTKEIPLEVKPKTRFVLQDTGGIETGELQREIETQIEGIAYNYAGDDLLKNESAGLMSMINNPLWIILILLPPIFYLCLLLTLRFGPLNRGRMHLQLQKKAINNLKSRLNSIAKTHKNSLEVTSNILITLKDYLAAKLSMKAGSLTYSDIEKPLKAHDIKQKELTEIKNIFNLCEAGRYAGNMLEEYNVEELCERTLKLAEQIQRSFN